jgi:hypothetical protein
MSDLHLTEPLRLHEIPGTHLFVMLWGGLLGVDVGRALGWGTVPQMVVLLVVAFACSVDVTPVFAAAIAATGWLVANGFVVHLDGQLGWAGFEDLARLLMFGVVAVAGASVRA